MRALVVLKVVTFDSSTLKGAGFTIAKRKRVQLADADAKNFYQHLLNLVVDFVLSLFFHNFIDSQKRKSAWYIEHKGRNFYQPLCDFMTSGPIYRFHFI